jgi:hypothetical protein
MASQLQAGAEQFGVRFRADAGEQEADITRNRKPALSLTTAAGFRQKTHVKPLNHLTMTKQQHPPVP